MQLSIDPIKEKSTRINFIMSLKLIVWDLRNQQNIKENQNSLILPKLDVNYKCSFESIVSIMLWYVESLWFAVSNSFRLWSTSVLFLSSEIYDLKYILWSCMDCDIWRMHSFHLSMNEDYLKCKGQKDMLHQTSLIACFHRNVLGRPS